MSDVIVYHFLKYEHAVKAIEGNCLKIATYEDSNDPFECYYHELESDQLPPELKAAVDGYRTNYGFLSFSENYTNPLMWAHYADNHNGICLGFKVDKDRLTKIDYDRGRYYLSYAKDDFLNLFDKFLNTKLSDWRYEEESRLVLDLKRFTRNDEGIYLCGLDGLLTLEEAYVGMRAADKYDEFLKKSTDSTGINPGKVVNVSMSITDFKIGKKIV